MNIEQIIAQIVECARDSRNYSAFKTDMEKCATAWTMCGLPEIKAEVWLEHLQKMTPFEIFSYVENRYVPGLLNPFDPRT